MLAANYLSSPLLLHAERHQVLDDWLQDLNPVHQRIQNDSGIVHRPQRTEKRTVVGLLVINGVENKGLSPETECFYLHRPWNTDLNL